MASKPNVVLVHGGFMGGWCWRLVADRLTAMGARVFTPTLTGLGERAHLLTSAVSLQVHVDDILNLIRYEQLERFVLCGHSYGGIVISAVAERLSAQIESIIYLDAYNPPAAGCAWDALSKRAQEAFDAMTNDHYAIEPIAATGTLVRPENAAWVNALASAHPRRTMEDRIAETLHRETIAKKLFVRARGYFSSMLDASYEHARNTPGWRTMELPFAHNLMIDEPDLTTRILAEEIWPVAEMDQCSIASTTV